MSIIIILLCAESELMDSKENEKEEDEIPDPLKCCFRHGWNGATRNETLGAITLWFQDIPMLTLAVLFALVARSCKTPDGSDASPVLLDVGISATAAVAASCWRLLRSIARLGSSVGVRTDIKSRCLPTPSEAAYPPDTCAQYCVFSFYCGLVMQFIAIAAGISIIFAIWFFYAIERIGSNFDQSLSVYRSSSSGRNIPLFNLSANVIPPNGPFSYVEIIPSSQFLSLSNTYCLCEFEYRSQDSLIFYDAIEVIPVSADGEFCATRSGLSSSNGCYMYYLQDNLFYGYVDPTLSSVNVEEFHTACYLIGTHIRPKVDLNINVSNHINRTGFPTNNEELVVYYPNLRLYALFSDILASGSEGLKYNHPAVLMNNGTFYCALRLRYNDHSDVSYNYRGVWTDSSGQCSCQYTSDCESVFYQTAVYGYLTEGSHVVPYTECSHVPLKYIKPRPERVSYCPC